MLNISWFDMLCTLINLIVLFLLLKKFLFDKICKVMDERAEKIQKDLDEAAASKKDAAEMKENYEAGIANAHEEAVKITTEAKERADKEGELIVEEARKESVKIIADAQKSAQNEKAKAISDAQFQIADLAILAASRVISKNVGDDSDKEAVNEFLSEVGASK